MLINACNLWLTAIRLGGLSDHYMCFNKVTQLLDDLLAIDFHTQPLNVKRGSMFLICQSILFVKHHLGVTVINLQCSNQSWNLFCQVFFARSIERGIERSGSAPSFLWLERGTVRVKCFAQEQIKMSPSRARTKTLEPRRLEFKCENYCIFRKNIFFLEKFTFNLFV